MSDRREILKRMSDGFLPPEYVDKLYVVYYDKPPIQINGWSGMHFLSGILVKQLGYNYEEAFNIHFFWEVFQTMIGDNDLSKFEDLVDIFFDTSFYLLGYSIN